MLPHQCRERGQPVPDQRKLDSIGQPFGPMPGGLSHAVILVSAILGTVAASVIAMGAISMTPMLKYGYSTRHTMGVMADRSSALDPSKIQLEVPSPEMAPLDLREPPKR